MNFLPVMPNFNEMNNPMVNSFGNQMGNSMMGNDIFYKVKELENKIKILEQRVARLESEKGNDYYSEPDTSMYMI